MTTSYSKPKDVTYNIGYGYIINPFITKIIIKNKEVYQYESLELNYNFNYDTIISALMSLKYTNDQVTAITLNYLLTLHAEVIDPEKVKEYQQEYKELQEYRLICKNEAKRLIEYAEINDVHP